MTVTDSADSPGRRTRAFIEAIRLDAARTLLSQGWTLKAVAAQVGLAPTRLTRAFERRFGIPPSLFREVHRSGSKGAGDRALGACDP